MTTSTETRARKVTMEQIIENLNAHDWRVIDNHNDREEKLAGVFELVNGEIVQYVEARYQSLNMLYINEKDGRVHLSQASVGGTLMGLDIQGYNDSLLFVGLQIKSVYFADGREIPEFTVHDRGAMDRRDD